MGGGIFGAFFWMYALRFGCPYDELLSLWVKLNILLELAILYFLYQTNSENLVTLPEDLLGHEVRTYFQLFAALYGLTYSLIAFDKVDKFKHHSICLHEMIIYCEDLPYPEKEESGPQFEFDQTTDISTVTSTGAEGGSELEGEEELLIVCGWNQEYIVLGYTREQYIELRTKEADEARIIKEREEAAAATLAAIEAEKNGDKKDEKKEAEAAEQAAKEEEEEAGEGEEELVIFEPCVEPEPFECSFPKENPWQGEPPKPPKPEVQPN